MLNKPTNVSPYNEFIDINNGLDLNFTLNNAVDALSVDIYKDDGSFIGGELIDNTSLTRDFSYVVPEDVMFNIANGDNYYWKTRYWKNPLEENKREPNTANGELKLNYWNENTGVLGLYSPGKVYIPEHPDETGAKNVLYSVGLIQNGYQSNPIRLSGDTVYIYSNKMLNDFWEDRLGWLHGENIYIYMSKTNENGDEIFAYAYVNAVSSYNANGDHFLTYTCPANKFYIMGEPISYRNYEQLFGASIYLYELSLENLSCDIGDYIYIKNQDGNGLYKIKSMNIDTYNGTPSIGLSIQASSFDMETPEGWGAPRDDIEVSIYSTVEYNESPPYYFSCRETPSISFYDVSISSPQIKIYANLAKYIEINSYSYQLYRLNDSNDWQLIWESSKTSTLNVLEDGTYDTEIVIYNGITPMSAYKIKLVGQTVEGQDIVVETMFSSENFSPTETKEFVSFNKDKCCIEINNSTFISSTPTSELQVYRYDVLRDELSYVGGSTYDFNTITVTDGLSKKTALYDFNIISGAEYIYYAYIVENDAIVASYVSNSITPSWGGVYLVDVSYEDSNIYKPDLSNIWFISLNNEVSEITRNYQISHPFGINQKYPKSVRGKANFKTGKVSGLLGNISCTTGDYEEGLFLINEFDAFCANGNLKLLRSDTKGEHMIVDIDTMNSSVFGQIATAVNVGYTQIDDIAGKQISVEV